MRSSISTYIWPGQTHFGSGAAELAGAEAKAQQARHAFIVTDAGIVAAGLLQPILTSLQAAELATTVYDQIPANPDTASVDAAAAALRQSQADLVLAVGGGSALDAAKAVRLLAGGPAEATIAEYFLLLGDKARPAPSADSLPPLIAVPTTAGTGSEVTPWAVITDPERELKTGVGGPYLVPTVALIDPDLTKTLSPTLTAATGLDALSHCIEAYVSTNGNPALDPMILTGIDLIGGSLRTAVAQPGNRAARSDVMLASMIGGIAISSKWLGACHSLAHQLSTFADVHHGTAIALMLPHQMAYSLIGAQERYAHIGRALDPSYSVPGSLAQRARWAVEAVRQLVADVDLPTRLREVGVTEEMIPSLARQAYTDLNWVTNPRLVSEAVMAQLYREAL